MNASSHANSVQDLFGNAITVSDLAGAIVDLKSRVQTQMSFLIQPFRFDLDGAKHLIPERAGEKVKIHDYHLDLLHKLVSMKAEQAGTTNLASDTQTRLVSALGCLVESFKTTSHGPACICQQCMDIQSAEQLLDEIESEPATPNIKTYNHAFSVGFEVRGSTNEDGEDVTAEQLRDALYARVKELMASGAMLEAVGGPDDTYVEGQ